MKTKLILIFALILVGVIANGQTRYYQTETTYTVGNNTLETTIEKQKSDVLLHDVNANLVKVEQTARNGGPIPGDLAMRRAVAFTSTPEMFTHAKNVITESLSAQSKQLTKGRKLIVQLIINPDTGRVWEVNLGFSKQSPFAFVTPAEYNTVINRLKNEISVTMTPEGKDLNYASSVWLYESK